VKKRGAKKITYSLSALWPGPSETFQFVTGVLSAGRGGNMTVQDYSKELESIKSAIRAFCGTCDSLNEGR